MSITKILTMTFILIFGVLVAACGFNPQPASTTAGHEVVTPKTERRAFCGVETWKEGTGAVCGTVWKQKRSSNCDFERYESRAHASCPGSIPHDKVVHRKTEHCGANAREPAGCPAGYGQTDFKVGTSRCKTCRDCEMETFETSKTRTCERAQHLATCSKPEFGTIYKSCRHKNHGREHFKTCRHKDFGPAVYKKCSFHMEPDRIDSWLQETRYDTQVKSKSLITMKGAFYYYKGSKTSLACTIIEYEADPLVSEEQVEDLIGKYQDLHGILDRSEFDCSGNAADELNIATYRCSEDDHDLACQTADLYQTNREWFENQKKSIDLILTDPAVRRHNGVKRKLNMLKTELTKKQR